MSVFAAVAAAYLRSLPFGGRRGAESVEQHLEIELAFLQVGAFDADAHGVAQRHAAARRAADDLVVGLVELEEVAVDVAQERHALDMGLVQLPTR